jgi:2-C-methyl-D-erythritol 4-phosphate cytidylyltransferase
MIHDGVRPLLTKSLLDRLLTASAEHDAVAPAVRIVDTIKRVNEDLVAETVDRSGLWMVQTPQVFSLRLILEAHESARKDGFTGTDDCELVERLSVAVFTIQGERTNIKITTREDLFMAERLLSSFPRDVGK